MSEAKRAYNILRGYVNQEWERVKGLEVMDAWRELDTPVVTTPAAPANSSLDTPTSSMKANELEATARTILNVTAKASFDEIRKAFEQINQKVQPQNFESGSEEAKFAQELLRKATWAYQFLTKDMSPSQRRFRSLEIE
jgi:glutamyl-tRNA reductase